MKRKLTLEIDKSRESLKIKQEIHDMTPSLIIRGRLTQDEMVWACSTHVSVDIFNRKARGEDTTRRSRSRWQTNINMGIKVVIR
jgi:hypothetical protein